MGKIAERAMRLGAAAVLFLLCVCAANADDTELNAITVSIVSSSINEATYTDGSDIKKTMHVTVAKILDIFDATTGPVYLKEGCRLQSTSSSDGENTVIEFE